MDDPSPSAEPVHEAVGGADRRSPPSAPRWAKVFGIVAAVAVLLLLVLLLTGNDHGPGRHLGDRDGGSVGVEHSVPHP